VFKGLAGDLTDLAMQADLLLSGLMRVKGRQSTD
jgi:hypothetical protein